MQLILQSALNLFLPQENVCHLCGRWADREILCEKCLQEMAAQRLPGNRQTRYAHWGVRVVVSCWNHESVPRKLVHLLKYRSDPRAAVLLAQGMTAALLNEAKVLKKSRLIVPVPLHPLREKERGYNQAELLAREISAAVGLPVRHDLLYRTRQTGVLARMHYNERKNAVCGAFAVSNAKEVRGRSILLVDDVYTTGATSNACAEALYQAGAQAVYLITACRA